MLNFKKAFTLMEVAAVIVIMSLLMYATSKLFSSKDIDKARFDTCYIASYAKINSFFQSAILQKMIYTGGEYKAPVSYDIILNTGTQELTLVYSGIGVKKTIKYFGTNIDKEYGCYSPTYYTKISGDSIEMNIEPGLQSDNKFPIQLKLNGNLIENTANASGVIYFLKCSRNNFCEQRYKMEFLPKAYLIKTFFCRKINQNNGQCLTWSN